MTRNERRPGRQVRFVPGCAFAPGEFSPQPEKEYSRSFSFDKTAQIVGHNQRDRCKNCCSVCVQSQGRESAVTGTTEGAWRKGIMSWFKRQENEIEANPADKTVRTEGLWQKCDGCGQSIFKKEFEDNLQVCPKCGHHLRLEARLRVASLLEPGYELVDLELISTDPLEFVDIKPYRERLEKARSETGLNDAVINALGNLGPHSVVLSVMEFAFIGGSMGCVVGETIARAIDRALAGKLPLIIVAASGGARMMEGVASLMQLAKVSAGLAQLDDAGLPYISVLTHPTTGGVTASFGMLGDLNIAEPGALIGFAGPRVIEQTIRQKLPEGFQRSEFLLEHGMLDAIVSRRDLKGYLIRVLDFMLPCKAKSVAAPEVSGK
jgi:acetyl-CoA carboxylase carboxyl transferase subunit beta